MQKTKLQRTYDKKKKKTNKRETFANTKAYPAMSMLRSTSFSRSVPQPPAGSSPTANGRNGLLNTSATLPRGRVPNAAPHQQQQHPTPQHDGIGSPRALAMITDLTFAETNQIRAVWSHSGNEYLRDVYALRSLLGELALYPNDEEMSEVLDAFQQKVTFNGFVRYVTYLKGCHALAASTATSEFDTARAFVALGGDDNLGGSVSLARLREACQKFHLTIDVDGMVAAAAIDPSGGIVDFSEFKRMWELRHLLPASGGNDQQKSGDGKGSSSSRHNSNGNRDDATVATSTAGQQQKPPGLNNLLAVSQSTAANNNNGNAPVATPRRPQRDHSSASAEDDDLMYMLVTGQESGEEGPSASTNVSPRSVLRSIGASQPDTNIGGGADSTLSASPFRSLRDFLLNDDSRRRNNKDNLQGTNSNETSLRRNNSLGAGGKRNAPNGTRRFTTLPNIRSGAGILANAADAERAALGDSDMEGDDAPLGYNTNAGRIGGRVADQHGGADQQPPAREEKVGYRAPSPMILSQYTATRHRPEGNKLGLTSPPGATNKGTSIGMTRQPGNVSPLSASASPMKKSGGSGSGSPRKYR